MAYVLWEALGQFCRRAGPGDEPRRVLDELRRIQVVEVVLPTRQGVEIRKRCVPRPSDHQAIPLLLSQSLPSKRCDRDIHDGCPALANRVPYG